jgi:hypothetical protein
MGICNLPLLQDVFGVPIWSGEHWGGGTSEGYTEACSWISSQSSPFYYTLISKRIKMQVYSIATCSWTPSGSPDRLQLFSHAFALIWTLRCCIRFWLTYSQMDSSSQAMRDDAWILCIFSVCFFYIAYRNVVGQKIWVEKTNVQLCDCSTSNWRYIATPTFSVFCCILLARFEDFNFF